VNTLHEEIKHLGGFDFIRVYKYRYIDWGSYSQVAFYAIMIVNAIYRYRYKDWRSYSQFAFHAIMIVNAN
jgi:hypothetical protein